MSHRQESGSVQIPDVEDALFAQLPTPSALLLRDDVAGIWRVARVSESLIELTGDPVELCGLPVGELFPELVDLLRLLEVGGRLKRLEATCNLPSQDQIPVVVDVVRLRDHRGVAILQMEPRHEAGRRRPRRSSERHMREIANNVNALIYLKRTDGGYTFVNRYYESIVGTALDQIRGKTDFDLWPDVIARSYRDADAQVMASGVAMEFEEPIPRDGVWGMWLSLKFPLYDDDGSLYGVGGISTDISERNAAEAAIRGARDEAERANRAKSEFLSRMSHELRTPLNSILGFGQLLQLENLPEPAGSEVESIVTSGQHLLTLINEVLDISRIESGASGVEATEVLVCEPLRGAYDMIKPLAAARGVELALDLHGVLYEVVKADAQRLKQVFLNVLMNAVKYNRPDGVVTITGEVCGERIRVLIADTGPGIAQRDIDRIFAPFERLGAEHRHIEGTGLGLTVSRSLMEAMGGAVGINRSVVGRGSEFYIELDRVDSALLDHSPAFAVRGDRGSEHADVDLAGTHILYIEDNPTNVDVVARIVERAGRPRFSAEITAKDGLEAVYERRPDVVLLDVNLPDMHGEGVLQSLRGRPETADLPVIVLSADATATQRERLLRAGASDYLTKPVDVTELLNALQAALPGPAR